MFLLNVNNVTKLYKNNRGSENISFSLEAGEVLGLLGPNGSGKTTIMKMITSLLVPQRGEITINGHNIVTEKEKAMSGVGALIEAPALIEFLSAKDNLKFASRYYDNITTQKIHEMLDLCGILRYKNDKVSSFSLGMRQRTGLALALLSEPNVIILDEPVNGLDIEGIVQVREIIKEKARNGAAVLVSSHLAHEIELCSTRVAIMHEGLLLNDVPISSALEQSPSLEDFFLAEVSRYRKGVSA